MEIFSILNTRNYILVHNRETQPKGKKAINLFPLLEEGG